MKRLLTFLFLGMLVVPILGFAQTNDSAVAALKAQIDILLKQIESLSAQLNTIKSGNISAYSPTNLMVGKKVTVTDRLRVRTQIGGPVAGVVTPGTTGTVIGEEVVSGGYTWVKVRYNNGLEGYSAKDWLHTSENSGVTASTPVIPTTPVAPPPPTATPAPPVATPTVPPISYTYACGDINADSVINQADVDAYKNFMFYGATLPAGVNGDLNGDGFPDAVDLNLLVEYVTGRGPVPQCGLGLVASVMCGDLNRDNKRDNLDVTYMTNYLFYGAKLPSGVTGDLDADGSSDSVDFNLLVNHVHHGGLAPTCVPKQKIVDVPSSVSSITSSVYACGDVDGDGSVDLDDVSTLTGYLFQGKSRPVGEVDLNNDGFSDAVDLNLLIDYATGKGPVPLCQNRQRVYSCGDLNLDGKKDDLDLKYMTNYLFYNTKLPSGVSADLNLDGSSDAVDLNLLVDGSRGRNLSSLVCTSGVNPSGVSGPAN